MEKEVVAAFEGHKDSLLRTHFDLLRVHHTLRVLKVPLCAYARARARVCVCVRARARACVRACVCVREREREQ